MNAELGRQRPRSRAAVRHRAADSGARGGRKRGGRRQRPVVGSQARPTRARLSFPPDAGRARSRASAFSGDFSGAISGNRPGREGGSECAGSSDTSAVGPPGRCCSRASSGWSTAAMTRPGSRCSKRDGLEYVRAVGNLQFLKDAAESNVSQSTTGLGHTRWATHGGVTEENAHPLTALRRPEARDRAQRHRRELPRAARGAAEGGAPVHLRDRRRGRRAPARDRLRRRSRRGRAHGVRPARGPFHVRRDPSRPPEPPRRRAAPDADGRRSRRRRELPCLEPGSVPRGDAPRAVPGRRRRRIHHAAGSHVRPRRHRRGGRARRARGRLGR